MFAIIDIETCGNKYEYRRGRITEICIIQHDGLSVTNVFTSLVNPECNISSYFVNISGITNQMVEGAPRFHEIARQIIELTEGRIFIAHNVGFDYGFIKDEFAALGYSYRRETLCTVKLSRKLMPGKLSYSLGNLCASIGIEINNRHRAEGDALATAELFNRLLELKNLNPQYKHMGVEALMARRIDKMKDWILKKIPDTCGVYYFLNKEKEIIYIGKSINMYQRAISHFNNKEKKGQQLLNNLYDVDFVETGSELIALLLESEEIKNIKPKFNRARKAHQFSHSLTTHINKSGVICFSIHEFDAFEEALISFTSYGAAREKLEQWIDEYALCLAHCGLTAEDSICFDHQIKKCLGICSGEESVEAYNARAQKITLNFMYPHHKMALIHHGRKPGEKSLIVIDNGKYIGHGYIDAYTGISCFDDCLDHIRRSPYLPDNDLIIKAYLKKEKLKTLVF